MSDVVPVCAVGTDEAGGVFADVLAAAGCRVDGIVAAARPQPVGGAAARPPRRHRLPVRSRRGLGPA